METKQTTESTETDAQFKIDYNSEKYYEAVSNKLSEISDTLSAMLRLFKRCYINSSSNHCSRCVPRTLNKWGSPQVGKWGQAIKWGGVSGD